MCAWVCERACVYYYYNRASVCMYVCLFVCYATPKCVASRASRVYDSRKEYYFLEIHPLLSFLRTAKLHLQLLYTIVKNYIQLFAMSCVFLHLFQIR